MKKSLLSIILLFIAWAVSAAAISTPMAIVRLEDAGSPNSRVHRSYAQVCSVGMHPKMCPTGHGFQPDGIGVLPHATRLMTLPGHTSAKLRCTRLRNESVSCGHVGDSIEYSAFPGGYFTPEGVFYYITDWQGNNIAVFSDKGALVQQTTYYPYGEPTIEPTGQRYLFGGKEREHAGGRNSYDFGPRNLGPSGNWDSTDRKATENYPISPFSYCNGDPINYIDPDGNLIIFVNGMHAGDGGSAEYWGNIDKQIMDKFKDHNALYYDGSIGGTDNISNNIFSEIRQGQGYDTGYRNGGKILETINDNEKIKFVTHSMGASYCKGLIAGLIQYGNENGVDMMKKIDFELDLAPFQPKAQSGCEGVQTLVIQHAADPIALPFKMSNADCRITHKLLTPLKLLQLACPLLRIPSLFEHSVKSFRNNIENIKYDEQKGIFYKH